MLVRKGKRSFRRLSTKTKGCLKVSLHLGVRTAATASLPRVRMTMELTPGAGIPIPGSTSSQGAGENPPSCKLQELLVPAQPSARCIRVLWREAPEEAGLEIGRSLEKIEERHRVGVQRFFHKLRPGRAEGLHGQSGWRLDDLLAGSTLDLGNKIRERA